MALADWLERALVAQERFAQVAQRLRPRAVPVSEWPHWALGMLELARRPVERAKDQVVQAQMELRARPFPLVAGDWMWIREPARGPAETMRVALRQVQS